MFLIMGIENKEKIQHYDQNLGCHACDGNHGFDVVTRYNFFHFFFLPLWKWGYQYEVLCSCCGTYYTLKEESLVKIGKDFSKITYWDIEPVNMKKTTYYHQRTCSECGYTLQDEFSYCPRCGNEVK